MLNSNFKTQVDKMGNMPKNAGIKVNTDGSFSTDKPENEEAVGKLYNAIYNSNVKKTIDLRNLKTDSSKKVTYIDISGDGVDADFQKLLSENGFKKTQGNQYSYTNKGTSDGDKDENYDPQAFSKSIWKTSGAGSFAGTAVQGAGQVAKLTENLVEEVNKIKKLFNYGK